MVTRYRGKSFIEFHQKVSVLIFAREVRSTPASPPAKISRSSVRRESRSTSDCSFAKNKKQIENRTEK